MKNLSFVLYLTLLFHFGCQSSGEYFEDAFCIENISTIDSNEGLKENQTVVVKDGKILKITSSNDLKLDPENEIIDGTGKFLIPGLWDAHVHFAFLEELAPSMFDLFLAYGITSVRDTGGKIGFVKEWKDKADANPTEAPRVMIAGPLLDGMPNVYDGSDPGRPPLSVGLSSIEDVKNQINFLDSVGVDLLKAYEMLTPEQFATITKLAREKGLKVTGHVPLSMDVISASNAGLNSMEHMRNLELACASNSDELLTQRHELLDFGKNDPGGILRSRIHQAQRQNAVENYDENKADSVLKVLAENQTWQIPTLSLNTGSVRKHFDQPNFQESFRYLPDSVEQNWKSAIENMAGNEISEFTQKYFDWKMNMVSKIHETGIGIMAGTDCPIFFLTPGLSLHDELEVLAEAGLSPLEALKTATFNPAKYFDLENELGSIKENYWADLVILDANPLENIKNTQRINAVIREGKYYGREALDRVLKRLENRN